MAAGAQVVLTVDADAGSLTVPLVDAMQTAFQQVRPDAVLVSNSIAAPLAAVTGFRMSGMWPKMAEKLSRAYPIGWARALHFPVMLYFVVFIAIHVFLVLATGALRNLNQMYAAQGSVDPSAYADNWTGFWFLVASLVVIAAAWIAARPLVLAPIAKLFGTVSALNGAHGYANSTFLTR